MATENTRPQQPATPDDPHGTTTRLPAHGGQSCTRVIDTGRGQQRPPPPAPGQDGLSHEGSAPIPDPG